MGVTIMIEGLLALSVSAAFLDIRHCSELVEKGVLSAGSK